MELPGGNPIVLIAVLQDRSLAALLDAQGYAVIEPGSGAQAVQWARTIHPDIIVLDAQLPDMSGLVACRMLRADPDVERNVPILVLASDKPTPELRVTAVSAGAWDFLRYPGDTELTLKIEAYVQAKRSMDTAAQSGSMDPVTRIHSRLSLVRRARELGALMVRCRQPLGCMVFEIETEPASPRAGALVAEAARLSDLVGAMGPGTFAVVAPATDAEGMLDLAKRVSSAVRGNIGRHEDPPAVLTIRAGYDAVAILTYEPMDPAVLIGRAATAVRHGTPEPGLPWVRRFQGAPFTAGAKAIMSPEMERSKRR